MVAAGQLAELQFWEQASQERQLALIQKTGLPTQVIAGLDIDSRRSKTDKKVKAGQVRFVPYPDWCGNCDRPSTTKYHPPVLRQILNVRWGRLR